MLRVSDIATIAEVSGGRSAGAVVATLDRGSEGSVGDRKDADGGSRSFVPRDASRRGPGATLGVLVGSDDPFTRLAFRSGARGSGVEVLGEGTVAAVSQRLAAELEPDVVLLDVQTTAAQALRAIQQIRARVPGTRILACTAPAGTDFGLLCLTAGAGGYMSKDIDLVVLPRVLRALANGEAVIPRALATELVKRFTRPMPRNRPASAELSAPECRLLELLRTGSTLPEAAAELGVTPATARRHFGGARRKLSASPPASARGGRRALMETIHWRSLD